MKFKVGDEVEHKNFGVGIIKHVGKEYEWQPYAVEFYTKHKGLHSCEEKTASDKGWWCAEQELELVSTTVKQIERKLEINIDGKSIQIPEISYSLSPSCAIDCSCLNNSYATSITRSNINIKNEEENKNMKLLDIYEKRIKEEINESYNVTINDLKENDTFTKLAIEYENQFKELYKNEFNEEKEFKFVVNALTKETEEKIEKAKENKDFELFNLAETLEEVRAQLELATDYETQIKILKKYEILNKDGVLNV